MYYKGMHVYIDYNKYIDHHFMTIVIILYQQQKHQKAGEHLTLSGTWLKSQEYNHNHTCTHGVFFFFQTSVHVQYLCKIFADSREHLCVSLVCI